MTDSIIATGYRSYLVRFWQSTEQGAWRASAQCVQTGNTVLFGDVESLIAFLQCQVGLCAEAGTATTPPSLRADILFVRANHDPPHNRRKFDGSGR